MVYEFLLFCSRLWFIMWHSHPHRGFPIVRATFDVLEHISLDPSEENVGPPLRELMREINYRSPGAVRVAMRDEP